MTEFTIIRESRYRIAFSLQTAHDGEEIIIIGTMYIHDNPTIGTNVLIEIYRSWAE